MAWNAQSPENLLFLSVAAMAGVFLMSAQLAAAGADSMPLPASDCPEGLDCPPPEHASGKADPPSSITAGLARSRAMGPGVCPYPFAYAVEEGGDGSPAMPKCVLNQDAVLNETLELSSFTTLDCQNHVIRSSRNGTNLTWPDGRSSPEVAIFLNGAYGVSIRNCIIEGFDFGIVGLDSKAPPEAKDDPGAMELLGNRITNNTIEGRFVAVELISVDNARILGNIITARSADSVGVLVLRDSDGNVIRDNTISNLDGSMTVVDMPGPRTSLNPIRSGPASIYISQGSGFPNLINAVIGGTVYQFSTPNSTEADENFSADNVVEANQLNSIGVSNSQRAIVRNNNVNIGTSSFGVIFGAAGFNTTQRFPGRCSDDPARLCLADSDCFIQGVDETGKGVCENVTSKIVLWVSDGGIAENNNITGPFRQGFQTGARNMLIQGNNITGQLSNGTDFSTDGGSGIALNNLALESATITRNVISNVPAPLRFLSNTAFGAKISLNDFTNYTAEVLVPPGYNQTSELSVLGKGNYWGLSCDGGFDPEKALSIQAGMVLANGTVVITGTPNPYVADSHPYGEPVAGTPDQSLPATCQ